MFKIRKGDTVQVIKGKDAGKKGKVLTVFTDRKRVVVEGLNIAKKHTRQTRQDQKGGIVSIEVPIAISNLMLLCSHCGHPSRIGFKLLSDGTKSRFCKSCKEVI